MVSALSSCAAHQLGQGQDAFLFTCRSTPDVSWQGAGGLDVKRLSHLPHCLLAPFCSALWSKAGFISSWKEGKQNGGRPDQASGVRETGEWKALKGCLCRARRRAGTGIPHAKLRYLFLWILFSQKERGSETARKARVATKEIAHR